MPTITVHIQSSNVCVYMYMSCTYTCIPVELKCYPKIWFQVLSDSEAPSLTLWQASQCPLCSISVDNSRGIEDAGSHTLQVHCSLSFYHGIFYMYLCIQLVMHVP